MYCVKSHAKFISGDETEDEIIEKLIANYEEHGEVDEKFTQFALHWKYLTRDMSSPGQITEEEFDNYYSALSASIKENGIFDLIMREAYNL